MSRMIRKKGLVLFLFLRKTYVLDLLELSNWDNSNKYLKHMFLKYLIQYSFIISD